MTMMMAMTPISCEELGAHAVAEASTREHPREATIIEQARGMPKCANIAPWQMRCIQGHIAANLQPASESAISPGSPDVVRTGIKRVFKNNFGCTPHQYLIRRRVERAQRLLLMSDDPLTQIAAECGFVSQSHLSYLFHRIVGERPGRWRRTQVRQNF